MKRSVALPVVGIAVALASVVWLGIVAAATGAPAWPAAGLPLGILAAFVAGRWVGRLHPAAGPVVLAAAPLLLLAMRGTRLLEGGVLGYANASGAVSFLGACGAAAAARCVRESSMRTLLHLVAGTWVLVPLLMGSHAAGLLGLLAVPAIVLVDRPPRARRLVLAGSACVACALVVTAVLGALEYRPSAGEGLFDRRFDQHLSENRVVLWGEALEIARSAPLLGVGPGNFSRVSPTAAGDADLAWAHNEFLEVFAEAGLPGGFLLLALVACGFVALWPAGGTAGVSPVRVAAVVGLTGSALHATIDYIWHFPEVPVALALLVGAGTRLESLMGAGNGGGTPPISGARKWDGVRRSDDGRGAGAGSARDGVAVTAALWVLLLFPVPWLNPPLTIENGARSIENGSALSFDRPGMVITDGALERMYRRIARTGGFTVELWVMSHRVDQGGPARILSASAGTVDRNFTIGQEGDALVLRLRTTATSENGTPQLEVPGVFEAAELRHLLAAMAPDTVEVYVDGALRHAGAGPGGDLTSWDRTFPLILGNETTGNRTWLGTVRSVAIYDQLLDAGEAPLVHVRRQGSLESAVDAPVQAIPQPFIGGQGIPEPLVEIPGPAGFGAFDAPLGFVAPPRVPAPDRSLVETLRDPGGSWSRRVAGHGIVFLLWAMVLASGFPSRWRLKAGGRGGVHWIKLAAGGALLAAGAVPVRHALGHAPSVWDVAGALVGLGFAWILVSTGGAAMVRRATRVRTRHS